MTAIADIAFDTNNRRRVFTIKDPAEIDPLIACGKVMRMTALDEQDQSVELEFTITRNELFRSGTRWIYGALLVPQGTVQVEIKLGEGFHTLELYPYAPALL